MSYDCPMKAQYVVEGLKAELNSTAFISVSHLIFFPVKTLSFLLQRVKSQSHRNMRENYLLKSNAQPK